MSIQTLDHAQVGNPSSGPFVLVLNDGALITAEDRAMLQALYSRSPASVLEHLERLAQVGSGKFMDQFYVGYGHKSIGDCGDTTIFIENVSMLVAKAVQDWALYNGQEVSTRYIDFATQPFVNALGIDGDNPHIGLRNFYVEALPILKEDLKKRFPIAEGEKVGVHEKAIAARAFDILRGFIPAGAQTNLAWTTNLRQAADKLAFLRAHPLKEVREVAEMISKALNQRHPHSFGQKRYEASEKYRSQYMEKMYYNKNGGSLNGVILVRDSLDRMLMGYYKEIIKNRPAMTELPKALAEIGTLQFEFAIDFGSFRDLARQRAVIQRMPLLTTNYGFHEWYLNELPEELCKRAQALLKKVELWWRYMDSMGSSHASLQYYLPMGYLVPCRLTGDLPALVYLVELRSGVTVHATLRVVAQEMAREIERLGIPVHIDRSESGRFDMKRGSQDIVSK